MSSPRETFLAHVRTPDLDTEVHELRMSLTNLKREALEQVARMDEQRAALVMPGLYEQLVQVTTQLAGHTGLAVALALTVLDEHNSGASVSRFDRELREQMSEISQEIGQRHSSRLAKRVAEVEAQRLVWRHSHEFMSWLAFRRGDERYPAKDRLERLGAFGVMPRLLEARGKVVESLGGELCAAIEGSDRFLLGNRWRLADNAEHALERYVWPLLSYQPPATVKIERMRWEYDAMAEDDESAASQAERLEGERAKLAGLLEAQLGQSLRTAPEGANAGAL